MSIIGLHSQNKSGLSIPFLMFSFSAPAFHILCPPPEDFLCTAMVQPCSHIVVYGLRPTGLSVPLGGNSHDGDFYKVEHLAKQNWYDRHFQSGAMCFLGGSFERYFLAEFFSLKCKLLLVPCQCGCRPRK